MAAKDIFHGIVKNALQKDGWKITHDPLTIPASGVTTYYIDLGAERIIAAQKGEEKIAVEIKSFIGLSFATEFHQALGQFNNYLVALEEEEPDRVLFLAVPSEVYDTYFETRHIKKVIERFSLHLLVFDPESENIVLWKM
ncbi:MAG: XisH family protein [Bacteroidia bacterium]